MASLLTGGKGKPVSEADLEAIITKEYYEEYLKDITSECGLSYAVNKILMEINEKRGAMLVKAPDREDIAKAFQKWQKSKNRSVDLREILKDLMLHSKSFSVGKSAAQAVMFIFGAPISAFLVKKVVPGGARVSDDIVLPAVTSLAVLLLATTNRL